MTEHHKDCGWHLDQYPWECTCGAIPRKAAMDELIADSADELWAKHEREHLFDRIEALTAENERLLEAMKDPNVVHVNMLRGGIAKPSVGQILHIYGEDVFRAALENKQ